MPEELVEYKGQKIPAHIAKALESQPKAPTSSPKVVSEPSAPSAPSTPSTPSEPSGGGKKSGGSKAKEPNVQQVLDAQELAQQKAGVGETYTTSSGTTYKKTSTNQWDEVPTPVKTAEAYELQKSGKELPVESLYKTETGTYYKKTSANQWDEVTQPQLEGLPKETSYWEKTPKVTSGGLPKPGAVPTKETKEQLAAESLLTQFTQKGFTMQTKEGQWILSPRGEEAKKQYGASWFERIAEQTPEGKLVDIVIGEKGEFLFFEKGATQLITKGKAYEEGGKLYTKEEKKSEAPPIDKTTKKITEPTITEKLKLEISVPEVTEEEIPWYEKAPAETWLTKFYETPYHEYIEKPISELETTTGLYVKESPIGEIRASQGVGWITEGAENIIKSGAAFGTLIYEPLSIKAKGEKVTGEERRIAASELLSSKEYLFQFPYNLAFVAGTAGELTLPKTTTVTVNSVTKEIVSKGEVQPASKFITTKLTEEGITYETKYGTQLTIPKGHPKYYEELVTATAKSAAESIKPLYPSYGIAKEAIKTGVTTAGIQTVADITFTGKPSLEKTKAAFMGGLIIGSGAKAYEEGFFKPETIYKTTKQTLAAPFDITDYTLKKTFDYGTAQLQKQGVKLQPIPTTAPPVMQIVPKQQPLEAQAKPIQATLQKQEVITKTVTQPLIPPKQKLVHEVTPLYPSLKQAQLQQVQIEKKELAGKYGYIMDKTELEQLKVREGILQELKQGKLQRSRYEMSLSEQTAYKERQIQSLYQAQRQYQGSGLRQLEEQGLLDLSKLREEQGLLQSQRQKQKQKQAEKIPKLMLPPLVAIKGEKRRKIIRKKTSKQLLNISSVKSLYADIFSVGRSQLRYGSGTSPSLRKRPYVWQMQKSLGSVPTAEELKYRGRNKKRGRFL
jgi:hypothetical protein